MKNIILFLLLLPTVLCAQHRDLLNFELKAALIQTDAATLPVYLRGDIAMISTFVRAQSGTVKGFVNDIVSCDLPLSAFAKLNDKPYITFVEYSASRPAVLGDMMITNNNVLPVHQGLGGLIESYKGQGVIIGIIDTGIELEHPDFQHADGSTRVVALWDQTQPESYPFRVPQPYGYGQEWNAEEINAGITGHGDQAAFFGHGSTVSGVAVGNANATGNFIGVAPEADIIVVSSNFSAPNWKGTVAESVEWIFAKAAAIGKPAVINASLGDYYGSHDALDAPALFIDAQIDASPGRAMVAAAGNSDQFPLYHLGYQIPETDTAFTWMAYNASSSLGIGAVFFEFWTDVADFENAKFTIGADLTVPAYQFRGYAGWRTAAANLDQVITDTIWFNGAIIGIVDSWCGQRGDQYQIQMVLTQPFSNQYRWRFAATGGGRFDCWSHAPFGTSAIVSTLLPSAGQFPDIAKYRMPDKDKTIVDSWTCSDKVLTVGNYVNRVSFLNYQGTMTEVNFTQGAVSINCSRGPTRDMKQKPNIAASGDVTLSAGRLATISNMIATNSPSLSFTGMHYSNGGTSMASPVVAGVAALYFSRCPLANWADVKSAIQTSAIADLFTGVLPGYQFGFGKTDAFGAMLTTVQPISLAPMSHDLCSGSLLNINAPQGYSNYAWSNGTQGANIEIETEGTYTLQAIDAKGCLQQSTPVQVTEIPSPPIPTITSGSETLNATGEAASWQWYLNDNPLEGAISNSYIPAESGSYTVAATGANGCVTFSLPFQFIITSLSELGDAIDGLYPNPAASEVLLSGLASGVKAIHFLDITGRVILAEAAYTVYDELIILNISGLSSGMYVVHAELINGSRNIFKLVVEK